MPHHWTTVNGPRVGSTVVATSIVVGIALAFESGIGVGAAGEQPWSGVVLVATLLGLVGRDDGDSDLERLTAAVEGLAAGEREVDVPSDRTDEVGRLATAVEELAAERRERTRPGADEAERAGDELSPGLPGTSAEALLDAVDDVFYVLDAGGDLLWWNASFREVAGYGDDELRSMHALDFFTGDDRDAVADAIAEVMDTGEVRVEVTPVTGDGETIPYEFVASRVDGPGGEPVIAGIGRDVSDRKARERELRSSKKYTDDLLDSVDDVFYVLDREGNLRRWNESLREVTGYEDHEIAEMHALDFFAADHREAIADAIEAVFETGNARVEAPFRTADGYSIPYEFVASRLEDPDGDPVVTGIGRDITERRRYERELERTAGLLAQAQRIADVAGWELDVRDEPYDLVATEELYRQVGLDPDDDLDVTDLVDSYHPEDRPRIQQELAAALDAGEMYDVVARFQRPDGTERWVHTIGEPVYEDGEVVALRGSMQDVTERVERERRLQERERQLSTLMSNVPGMVYRSRNEPGWPVAFASEGTRSLTGYAPEAFESGEVSWGEDVMLEGVEEAWEETQRAFDARESFQMTYPIETADGERRWVKEQGRGVYDAEGDVETLEGVIIDVTEQVESRRELERTTDLLEQAERLANLGAWEFDVAGSARTVWMSDEVARIHGISSDEEVDLEEALEFYHPDDRPEIRDAVERAVEDGEAYDLEVRLVTSEGDVRWVRTIGEPVEEDGAVVAVRGAFQDVTDGKERERELERYETIVQAIGDPVYALDDEGYLRFVNDAIEPLAGWDPDELVGEHVSTVMAEGDFETGREEIRELRRSDEPYRTFEMGLVRTDGGVVETENNLALLPGEDGQFAGIAGVVRDVTERNERERELERTTDLLEQAERLAGSGGWEVDLTTDPPAFTMTDGLRRLYELTPEEVPMTDPEAALDRVAPADRERVAATVDAAMERGVSYDVEHRMETYRGSERWVRSVGEPVFEDGAGRKPAGGRTGSDDGEIVAVRGSLQDITEHKERERVLESLHDTARGLLETESQSAAADLVVETAGDVLDVSGVALYTLDEGTNELDPVAYTPGFVEHCGPATAVAAGRGESLLWNAFVTGAQTVVDDPASIDQSVVLGEDVERALVVPIGDHGVFTVVSTEPTIGAATRRTVETLVATATAAFDRLESEAALRERDADLAERNRRLRRQRRIDEIIRSIHGSLVAAENRDEIERTVPEQLVAADGISFAWIGAVDGAGDDVEPRGWAGDDGSYLDAVALDAETSAEPAAVAARREEPTVVSNVVDELQAEPWRSDAIAWGFHSVVAVPLTYQEYTYGVLAVYADEPNAFAELERTVYAELGEGIANAINAVQTRAALTAEDHLELTLRVEAPGELLSRIARAADCRVVYEGLGARTRTETLCFFVTDGADPADVSSVLDDLVTVDDYRLVTESNGECLFEASVTGDVLASRLVRHGASPRSITADAAATEVVVDVATATDVRGFVELLAEEYATVELVARRTVQRPMQTRQQLVTALFDELTDRQVEVLRTAYYAGFFDWPRESTGEEVAEMLDVSQPTVNRHLRLGQRRLLAQLFEDRERAVPAP